jgi:hypothetical protein
MHSHVLLGLSAVLWTWSEVRCCPNSLCFIRSLQGITTPPDDSTRLTYTCMLEIHLTAPQLAIHIFVQSAMRQQFPAHHPHYPQTKPAGFGPKRRPGWITGHQPSQAIPGGRTYMRKDTPTAANVGDLPKHDSAFMPCLP